MANKIFSQLNRVMGTEKPVDDPDSFTSGEYAQYSGRSLFSVKKRLVELEKQGLVKRCLVKRANSSYPGWRWLGDKKGPNSGCKSAKLSTKK